MHLKPVGKLVVLLIVVGIGFGGYRLWQRYGGSLMPGAPERASEVPPRADLPSSNLGGEGASNGPVTLPGSGAGCADKPEVRMLGYAWNAQMGLLLAIGGPQSTNGSLM